MIYDWGPGVSVANVNSYFPVISLLKKFSDCGALGHPLPLWLQLRPCKKLSKTKQVNKKTESVLVYDSQKMDRKSKSTHRSHRQQAT